MPRICVFCGSSSGSDPRFSEAAEAFGRLLARRGLGLVYGGGRVGLMGTLAQAALDQGGEVLGVIPRFMESREVAHPGLTHLEWVDSMHARKARMGTLADAFVALPGGWGTLDELFEVLTWAQLGLHAKPVALLNLAGFWDPLLAGLGHLVAAGFVRPAHRDLLRVHADPEALLDDLQNFRPSPLHSKWA
ncbi:MAG: TIGR00730 family Rossman fold protein [Acidobacteria bacterium]|nr:TIGR00730 family Rossman fold protein [Acidobacteriota bacterium]